jgi:type IV conjugative transfer system protein TraL
MSRQDHVILNHIDAPTRILFWSASEFICCFFPIILGLFVGRPLLGFGLSIASIAGFKTYQKKYGHGKLRAILYRYFPSFGRRGVPPSFVRLWIK